MPIVDMQKGLHGLCEKAIRLDDGFSLAENATVDHAVFAQYRLHRLKTTVAYAYENSKWYREKMDEAGVLPSDIQALSDLSRLPFTTPDDIARGGFKFLCTSQADVEKPVVFVSSGTTGPQKQIYFSHTDVEAVVDFLGVGMHTVAPEGSAVQILLPDSAVRGIGTLLAEGVGRHGMRGYSTGMFLPAEEQIRFTLENKPSVWFGDTRVIYRITKEMEDRYDLGSLGVHVMFTTISEIPNSMRRTIESAWNCRVVTHYGLTEVGFGLAVDCASGAGFHYNEFGVIAEVVDPETGETLADGEEGELVFTTLGREAMPLLRYRSHDIASLTHGCCHGCGAELDTIGHVGRRLESVVEVRGSELYPTMFDDLMFDQKHVVDYEIYLRPEVPQLLFEVECITAPEGYAALLQAVLAEHPCIKGIMRPPEVRLLLDGALKRSAHFKKLIHIADNGARND